MYSNQDKHFYQTSVQNFKNMHAFILTHKQPKLFFGTIYKD